MDWRYLNSPGMFRTRPVSWQRARVFGSRFVGSRIWGYAERRWPGAGRAKTSPEPWGVWARCTVSVGIELEGANRFRSGYSTTLEGPLGARAAGLVNDWWALPARRRTSSSIEPKVCSCRWIVMPSAVKSRLAV